MKAPRQPGVEPKKELMNNTQLSQLTCRQPATVIPIVLQGEQMEQVVMLEYIPAELLLAQLPVEVVPLTNSLHTFQNTL